VVAARGYFKLIMTASYVPGDVIRTAFGVGVLISCPLSDDASSTDGAYQVRVWRMPGRSIGSSSVAFLRPDAVSETNYQLFFDFNLLFSSHALKCSRFLESCRRLLAW
jgi:hypothetical protein